MWYQTLGIWGAMTFSIMTSRVMTLRIKSLFVILSITDNQHKTLCSEWHYAECRKLFIVMLSVVRLNANMLSVIMLNVVAPKFCKLKIRNDTKRNETKTKPNFNFVKSFIEDRGISLCFWNIFPCLCCYN